MSVFYLVLVACGGAFGAVCRFLIHHGSRVTFGETFPVGTLAVNLMGSFLIGVCLGFELQKRNEPIFMGVVVGFMGSLTTFSSFAAESFVLTMDRQMFLLILNVAANVLGCLLAVALGVTVTKMVRGS